jgi:hypothetical protein
MAGRTLSRFINVVESYADVSTATHFRAEGQWTYWPITLVIMGYNKIVF